MLWMRMPHDFGVNCWSLTQGKRVLSWIGSYVWPHHRSTYAMRHSRASPTCLESHIMLNICAGAAWGIAEPLGKDQYFKILGRA